METDRIDSLLELALSKLPDNDISGALQVLNEASEIQPNNIELYNLKANCYYLLGDFFQAKQAWEKVLEWDSKNKTALSRLEKFESPSFQFWLKRYYNAIEAIGNKDFQEALTGLQKLIKENDGFVSLYQLLGLTYLALNDEKNANKVWQQGLKLDKNNEELLKYLNTPKKGRGRKRIASSQGEIKKSESKNTLLYIVSGMFIMLLLLQMSISLNTNKNYQATIMNLQNNINKLNEKLAQEKIPTTAIASNSLNIIEDTQEELSNEGSVYDFEQEKNYYKTGYQAYLAKDFKTAISNLSVVVSMGSNSYLNREALYYLALTYYVNNDYDNALKYYEQYLQEFPDTNYTDESLYYLGCVYYFKGNIEKAKMMLEELNSYDPKSGYKSTDLYRIIMEAN